MKIKHFGLVTAKIDKADKRITLTFGERGKGELDRNHPQRCLGWAISSLDPLLKKGYVLTCPEGE